MALWMGFEMGTHMIPFDFDNPLCPIFWIILFFSIGIQLLLMKKARRPFVRWLWIGLILTGLAACEVACQVITGWDLVFYIVLHFYLLTMLVGAGTGALLVRLNKNRK